MNDSDTSHNQSSIPPSQISVASMLSLFDTPRETSQKPSKKYVIEQERRRKSNPEDSVTQLDSALSSSIEKESKHHSSPDIENTNELGRMIGLDISHPLHVPVGEKTRFSKDDEIQYWIEDMGVVAASVETSFQVILTVSGVFLFLFWGFIFRITENAILRMREENKSTIIRIYIFKI